MIVFDPQTTSECGADPTSKLCARDWLCRSPTTADHFGSNLNLTASAPKLTSKEGEVLQGLREWNSLKYHWFSRMAKFDRPAVMPVAAELWYQWQGFVPSISPFLHQRLWGCGEGLSLLVYNKPDAQSAGRTRFQLLLFSHRCQPRPPRTPTQGPD